MVEFTGERVVPGQVSADLWSEHLARYVFARRYAAGKRVLDAGCGAGYGAAELAQAADSVTGLDAALDALQYAAATYPIPRLSFLAGSCAALPFSPASFDLVVAFEVIEHLAEYSAFIAEAARVLRPGGLFLVSSPNKAYYAESRRDTGPNPFHQHEFEAGEFHSELRRAFAHVDLLVQNRVECFAFHPLKTFFPADARIDAGGGGAADAHFLIAICSNDAEPDRRSFVYVPKAANLLREREQHVALLERQLEQTLGWLAETRNERDSLLALLRSQKRELEEHNRWAERLNSELQEAAARVVELQDELAAAQAAAAAVAAAYEEKLRELDAENVAKTRWALDTEARLAKELDDKSRELFEAVELLHAAEQTLEERTLWARQSNHELDILRRRLDLIRSSRWLKLGRAFGLGPGTEPS